ncbi:MAG: bifunctional folylpolyglutamate synthase/dihydrofolate synthase, partial [Clostridium perfringens]|nr:bifunctional folylpolyglutamate synthase/dihydrofolate synthase [Clostridium perfringens]
YKEAYNKAYSLTNEDDLLLICGSLYMVGDMRKAIRNNENTSLRSIKY